MDTNTVKKVAPSTPTIATILQNWVVYEKEPDRIAVKIAQTKKQLGKVGKIDASKFFGFEAMDVQIEDETTKLTRRLTKLKMEKKGFPEMDYGFLALRKKDTQLPVFAIFDLDESKFSLRVEPSDRNGETDGRLDWENTTAETDPELPEALGKEYHEAARYLANLSIQKYDWGEIEISTTFMGGVMPSDLRKKVNSLIQREEFDQIFVIAEAPKWAIGEVVRPKMKDPLVVGWIEETEQMFLIGSYNPTTLEAYIEQQYIK